jgi:signal transduction histidine kinase
MEETLFEELKRYVQFSEEDEEALRSLSPIVTPEFPKIVDVFYQRILDHEGARKTLEGGESQVGRLKVTLTAWLDKLLKGPWDEAYYELRCRIGRLHVRVALPQHYMFGAMNVISAQLNGIIDTHYLSRPDQLRAARIAVGKILDIELAIMLHTYREDLLAQQARTERLATFGQLVGSIGHELRNPLSVIETSVFILKGRAGGDERSYKHLDRIGEQLGIANRIISDLLDMVREKSVPDQSVELSDIVETVLKDIGLPAGVSLTLNGLAGLPPVKGDRGQLRQVFINLLENALHAVNGSGSIAITGSATEDSVRVTVEDSGPGVDSTIRRRLFEPLVTTKEKGIGLGLALVKRIVERHQGSIGYEPPPGAGARFIMLLPMAPSMETTAESGGMHAQLSHR